MNEVPGGTDPRSLPSLSAYLPPTQLDFLSLEVVSRSPDSLAISVVCGVGVAVREHPWPFSLHPPGAVLVSLSFQTPVSAATTSGLWRPPPLQSPPSRHSLGTGPYSVSLVSPAPSTVPGTPETGRRSVWGRLGGQRR